MKWCGTLWTIFRRVPIDRGTRRVVAPNIATSKLRNNTLGALIAGILDLLDMKKDAIFFVGSGTEY
jgi:hypothetical protein